MGDYRAYIGDLSQTTYLELIQKGLQFIRFEEIANRDTRDFH